MSGEYTTTWDMKYDWNFESMKGKRDTKRTPRQDHEDGGWGAHNEHFFLYKTDVDSMSKT